MNLRTHESNKNDSAGQFGKNSDFLHPDKLPRSKAISKNKTA
jgi:hypothetical protein